MQHTVSWRLVVGHRELGDDGLLQTWEGGDMTLRGLLFQVGSNQPTVPATEDPCLVELIGQAGMRCRDMNKPCHHQGVSVAGRKLRLGWLDAKSRRRERTVQWQHYRWYRLLCLVG